MNSFNTKISITKFVNSFTGQDGMPVKYEFFEIEFAPNCYATFKLNSANMRALQKYSPNMYQLACNVPLGHPIIYNESAPTLGIDEVYSTQVEENEL